MADLERVEWLLEHAGGSGVRLMLSKRIMDGWSEVAPEPWRSGGEPLVVLGGELVVRAKTSHGVRLLWYASGTLLEALHRQYGARSVAEIRVVAPSGR